MTSAPNSATRSSCSSRTPSRNRWTVRSRFCTPRSRCRSGRFRSRTKSSSPRSRVHRRRNCGPRSWRHQLAQDLAPDAVATDVHSIRIGGPTDGWHIATMAHEVVTEYALEVQHLWASDRLTLIGYADTVDCYLGTQDIVARLPGVTNEIPLNLDYEGCYSALWYGLPAAFTANAPEHPARQHRNHRPGSEGITGTPAVLTFDDAIFAFAAVLAVMSSAPPTTPRPGARSSRTRARSPGRRNSSPATSDP